MHAHTYHINSEPQGHIAEVVDNCNRVVARISQCYIGHCEVQQMQSGEEEIISISNESLLLKRVFRVFQLPGPHHTWLGETAFKQYLYSSIISTDPGDLLRR